MMDRVTVTEDNIEEIKDEVGRSDMSMEIEVGMVISHSVNDNRSRVLIIHDRGRGALCFNADSVWGEWDDEAGILRLDDELGVYTMLGEDVGPIEVEYSGGPGPYDTADEYGDDVAERTFSIDGGEHIDLLTDGSFTAYSLRTGGGDIVYIGSFWDAETETDRAAELEVSLSESVEDLLPEWEEASGEEISAACENLWVGQRVWLKEYKIFEDNAGVDEGTGGAKLIADQGGVYLDRAGVAGRLALGDEMYTVTEAAEALELSESRVRQLCQAGRMGKKVGRDWIITGAEVIEMMDRRAPGRPRRMEAVEVLWSAEYGERTLYALGRSFDATKTDRYFFSWSEWTWPPSSAVGQDTVPYHPIEDGTNGIAWYTTWSEAVKCAQGVMEDVDEEWAAGLDIPV